MLENKEDSKIKKAAYMREYRKKHPGASSKYTTAWAQRHRERDRELKRKSDLKDPVRLRRWQLWKKYHITLEQYDALLEKQNGVCAVCHKPPTPQKRLCIDHDHKCCGKVSCGKCVWGLLCDECIDSYDG